MDKDSTAPPPYGSKSFSLSATEIPRVAVDMNLGFISAPGCHFISCPVRAVNGSYACLSTVGQLHAIDMATTPLFPGDDKTAIELGREVTLVVQGYREENVRRPAFPTGVEEYLRELSKKGRKITLTITVSAIDSPTVIVEPIPPTTPPRPVPRSTNPDDDEYDPFPG